MRMNKIRLFFIINTHSAGGGAEAQLTTIVNALYDTGRYEIGLMEIIHHDKKKEEIRGGIKVYPYFTEADAVDRKARMYSVYHEWDKVIDEYIPNDYDIYISFNYLKPTFLLPKGKKCISWIHGDIYNLINKYPNQTKDMSEERELQRKAFKKADCIIAISDNTRQSIEDIYPEYKEKIRTIYNGIDVDTIRKRSLENEDIRLEKPSVLYIGRLEKGKDPIRTLDIFTNLHSIRPYAHLYYLGYGELENEVKREVENRGLNEFVHLLGYYDNPFPIIRQADVVLMTSRSEGFPVSLLESVALDVPFVSTEVGGSKELERVCSCGLTYNNNNDAVKGIIDFFDMDKDEIRKRNRNTIEKFSLNNYVSKIESIFSEVLNLS